MITGVGPYQVCTSLVIVENTHNFGGGTVQSARRDPSRARGDPRARRRDAPRRGATLQRPRRLRRAGQRLRPGVRHRLDLPQQRPRRPGRQRPRRLGRGHGRVADLAQALRRRHAPGRDPRRRRRRRRSAHAEHWITMLQVRCSPGLLESYCPELPPLRWSRHALRAEPSEEASRFASGAGLVVTPSTKRTSPPYWRTAATFASGAEPVSRVLCAPGLACRDPARLAWLPALAAATPASSASRDRPRIMCVAPRALNDPVSWRFSAFRSFALQRVAQLSG